MLTAKRLRELFHYNPETGEFTRLARNDVRPCWISRYVGKPVGTISGHGYWTINIDKQLHRSHRLAWLYMYGKWPNGHLDHKDNNRLNNRIDNLRLASDSQNRANAKTRSDSKSGIKGVRLKGGKWTARIRIKGNETYLGSFDTSKAAHAAYFQAAKKTFGEFARAK
jgi:HNH endonuclease/AP2 domain